MARAFIGQNLSALLCILLWAGCAGKKESLTQPLQENAARDIALVRALASPEERRSLRKLNRASDQTAFVAAFWQKRDPYPDEPGNLYREQMEHRAAVAAERFQEGTVPGYETDRGRMYLLYGEPGSIEQILHHPQRKPHEIWRFDPADTEHGMMHVFWDRDGFGRFTLLHSTFANEPFRPEWQRLVAGR